MTGIVITKIDADTAAPLAGAVFEISELNGSVINSYTTDATGVVHTETLAPGKYVVKEIKAPEGAMGRRIQLYYGVTKEDIQEESKRYSSLLTALASD